MAFKAAQVAGGAGQVCVRFAGALSVASHFRFAASSCCWPPSCCCPPLCCPPLCCCPPFCCNHRRRVLASWWRLPTLFPSSLLLVPPDQAFHRGRPCVLAVHKDKASLITNEGHAAGAATVATSTAGTDCTSASERRLGVDFLQTCLPFPHPAEQSFNLVVFK